MPPQLPSNRPAVIQHIRKNSQLRPSAHNVSSPFHSGLFRWRVSAENMETLLSLLRESVKLPRSDRLACDCHVYRLYLRPRFRSSKKRVSFLVAVIMQCMPIFVLVSEIVHFIFDSLSSFIICLC